MKGKELVTNINPQSQSRFITLLPREIRDLIYLAIWQSPDHGVRQHVIWHRDDKNEGKDNNHFHFCRWPCSLDKFNVEDPCQSDIEKERIRVGTEIGGSMHHWEYARRLNSPWFDHWACGEEAKRLHGVKAIQWHSTSASSCWRSTRVVGAADEFGAATSADAKEREVERERERENRGSRMRTSWLPMLLVCRVISAEVLKSIYESTTFILTDTWTLQHFLGFCHMPPFLTGGQSKGMQVGISPPGLFKYATSLEVSLAAGFSCHFYCSDPSYYQDPTPDAVTVVDAATLRDAYDFHWLRLDQFDNLRSLKIWVAARGQFIPDLTELVATPDLSPEQVKDMLSCLGKSKVSSIVLSMPLAEEIGPPEDGYVEGMSPRPDVRLWKRGTGDRFQPFLAPIFEEMGTADALIFIRPRREVHVTRRFKTVTVISPWGRWD